MSREDQAKLISEIGGDIAQEGGGEALIKAALDLVRGQVPPRMEMSSATQLLMEAAAGAAVAALFPLSPERAKPGIDDLADGFRQIAIARLTALRKLKGIA